MASSTNPISTIKTYLLKGITSDNTTTYAKLVDIKDYPDLFGEKEQLETTTLSDTARTYIAGLQSGDPINFTANYTYTTFNIVHTLDNGTPVKLRLAFGDEQGLEGYFDFEGYVSATLIGKGVNEVREFNIRVVLSSDITLGVKA